MATARTHFLTLPKGFLALRIIQLVVGVLLLCLASYGIYYFSYDGVDLTLFTAICTIIITGYMILAHTVTPLVYNYWAFLGLDIFLIIFWVVSFSVLAWDVAVLTLWVDYATSCDYYYYSCYRKRSEPLEKRYTTWGNYRGAMAAAAGFGGLEFILFTISLIMISLALVRHRRAGGHCTANTSPNGPIQQQNIAMEPKLYAEQQPQGGYPPQGAYAPAGPGQPNYPPQSYTPAPSYPQAQSPYQQPQSPGPYQQPQQTGPYQQPQPVPYQQQPIAQ